MYDMKNPRLAAIVLAVLMVPGSIAPAMGAGKDQDLLNQGKILMFDRKWDQAYAMFQRVIREYPGSPAVLQHAYFLSARCLQLQDKEVNALRAYEEFLRRFPGDPVLNTESANCVLELSASLIDKGDYTYKDRLYAGLKNPNKKVRYYAALRCGRLKDMKMAALAVPVLKEIVRDEKEPDFTTNRANIALLRLEPEVLATGSEEGDRKKAAVRPGEPRMLHLVVTENGSAKPLIEMNVPVSMAQMLVSALDESARAELRKKGYDVKNILEDFKRMGPTDIVTLRDGRKTIRLWIR